MPIITESSYSRRPLWYFNSYMETLIPYFTTKVNQVKYERERLELKDGDFIDLDWLSNDSNDLILISHGLEGNSKDHFIEKSAAALHAKAYDILVWHYRSCSGEMNRLERFYEHGDIVDLHDVILHASKRNYQRIILLGFSMGGTMVINYLGKEPHPLVKKGIVFSAPIDLNAAAINLSRGFNRQLEKSFVKKWKKKIERKALDFPNIFDLEALNNASSLREIYEFHILPLHGYPSLDDYNSKWYSAQFIPKIKVPLLIVNAKNDPLLSENCYPKEVCEKSKSVYLEIPKYGGHTGFTKCKEGKLWYVWRIEKFLE